MTPQYLLLHKLEIRNIILKVITYLAFSVGLNNLANAEETNKDTFNERPDSLIIKPSIERDSSSPIAFTKSKFDLSVFAGGYKFDGFNTSFASGIKLALYPQPKYFVEIVYAISEIDESLRTDLGYTQLLNDNTFDYFDLSIGINLLSGHMYFSNKSNLALSTDYYLIIGLGKINLESANNENIGEDTQNLGLGVRLALTKNIDLHINAKTHFMSKNLLDEKKSAQNLTYNAGLGFYF